MKNIKRLPANAAVDAEKSDISAAEDIGALLACFLSSIAGSDDPRCPRPPNKDAQKALLASGVGWIGDSTAKLIVDRLCAPAPAGEGKTAKSGAALFAKFLVPGKPTLRRQYARWLSTMVEANMNGNPTNEDYDRVADICQAAIDANDRIIRAFKDGSRPDADGYNPAIPPKSFGIVTKDKLQKAYLGFAAERDKRDGIHRAK